MQILEKAGFLGVQIIIHGFGIEIGEFSEAALYQVFLDNTRCVPLRFFNRYLPSFFQKPIDDYQAWDSLSPIHTA